MRRLDPSAYRTTAWKNGGGTTTEALSLPTGASIDDFELRVSMARVAAPGPFSRFDGVDRTLIVTSGAGLTLAMSDGGRVTLDATSAPFSFTGDDPVHATLADGPVTDFNVMTRRSALRHRAAKLALDPAEPRTLVSSGELALLLVIDGAVVASDDRERLALGPGDLLVLGAGEGQVNLDAGGGRSPAALLLVDFFRR